MKPQEEEPTSQWTECVIEIIQKGSPEAAQRALAEFCEKYRPVIYHFFRRQRLSHDEAEDWTQDFFASRILSRMENHQSFLHKFQLTKSASFRAFLGHNLRGFYGDKLKSTRSRKSGGGGGSSHIPLEDLEASEIVTEHGPVEGFAREFDRVFALEIVNRATERAADSAHLLAYVRGELSQRQAARDLGLSENAFRQAYHRFRQRLAQNVREEVAKVAGPEPKAVEEEIRYLMSVFAGDLDPAYAFVTSALLIPAAVDFGRAESSKQSRESGDVHSGSKSSPAGRKEPAGSRPSAQKFIERNRGPRIQASTEFVPPDSVRFSAFVPERAKPATALLVDVWAYLESQRAQVLAVAMGRKGVIEGGTEGTIHVPQGSQLTVFLVLPGFEIQEPSRRLWWNGSACNIGFFVRAPSAPAAETEWGMVKICCGVAELATVYFPVAFAREEDALPHEGQTEYVRSAFASYASADRPEVVMYARGAEDNGTHVFLDVLDLREGQDWERELHRHVPKKDRFYLFWSKPASESVWVEKEWRCALRERGINYISPVALADPRDVPPPPELAGNKHFNDLLRIVWDYERNRREGGAT